MAKKTYIVSYIILIVVMLILPFYSAENYSIISHSTSQLGAQLTRNAWVMNLSIAFMGLSTILYSWSKLRNYYLHKVLITIFGLSLIGCAIFSHAPIDINLTYNEIADKWHSIFASITGFSFVTFSISCLFIFKSIKDKTIAFSIGILASILSYLMFAFSDYKGLFQRSMFILAFAWILFMLNNFEQSIE